jgi:hypothetical protein
VNLFQIPHIIHLLEGLHTMTATDALDLAKKHPSTFAGLLSVLATAAQKDPALIPDVITAVETHNYAGLAVKHIGLLLNLAGIVASNQALVDQLGPLTAKA